MIQKNKKSLLKKTADSCSGFINNASMSASGYINKKVSTVKSNAGSLKRLFIGMIIAGGIMFVLCAIFIVGYTHKWESNRQREAEIQTVIEDNESLKKENESLKAEIEFLKTDSGVESMAREKLGLVKKNSEVAFIVVKDEKHGDFSGKTRKKKIKKEEKKKSDSSESKNVFDMIWGDLFPDKEK